MIKNRGVEIFLGQVVFYSILWIADDYIATYISVIFSVIAFFILIISFIVELIEPSKVPRSYYYFIVGAIFAPIFTAAIMIFLKGGLDWLS